MQEELRRIVDTKRLANPLKSYLWYVELPVDIPNFRGNVFEINSRISSINLPFPTFETDKETDVNSFWYFAKSTDIGNITLEITEHDDGMSYEYFQAWMSLISNSDGTFNAPTHYKRRVNFYRLDESKNKILIDSYRGYFVSGVSDVTNDYETNGLVKFTITLTGDSVTHINQATPNELLDPEISKFTEITQKIVNAAEFVEKVQNARTSAKSIAELLL